MQFFYYAFQSVCKGLTQSISALHGKDYLDCCTTDFHSFYLYHKIQVLVQWTKKSLLANIEMNPVELMGKLLSRGIGVCLKN